MRSRKLNEKINSNTTIMERKMRTCCKPVCKMPVSRREFITIILGPIVIMPTLSQCTSEGLPPVLEILTPNGGEYFAAQSFQVIRWKTIKVGLLQIEFSNDGGQNWTTIVENVTSETTFFEWQVPNIKSEQCLIRITDETEPALQDRSDAFFSIRESYAIQLSQHLELQQQNGFKIFDMGAFANFAIVVTGVNEFKVLSLTCTHAGCTVAWQETRFECPCHGSAFDKHGCVMAGPALESLWTYEYEFDPVKGVLTVFNRLKMQVC